MMQLQDCKKKKKKKKKKKNKILKKKKKKKKKKKERFQKQTNNKERSAYPITWFRGYKKDTIDVLNSKGQRER